MDGDRDNRTLSMSCHCGCRFGDGVGVSGKVNYFSSICERIVTVKTENGGGPGAIHLFIIA